MTTAELCALEDRVLAWIREAGKPISTTELLEQHRDDANPPSGEALRRAVWNLVDSGLVKYDQRWRLEPVQAAA